MMNEIDKQLIRVLKKEEFLRIDELVVMLIGLAPADITYVFLMDEEGVSMLPEWEEPPRGAYLLRRSRQIKFIDQLNMLSKAVDVYHEKHKLFKTLIGQLIKATEDGVVRRDISDDCSEELRQCLLKMKVEEYTKVSVSDVSRWVANIGFETDFFERKPASTGLASFFDEENPNYSKELAVAIEAWQRFSGLGISHPKEYLNRWLDEYHGSISEKAKDRIVTLVNWNSTGGAKQTAFKQALYDQAISKKLTKF